MSETKSMAIQSLVLNKNDRLEINIQLTMGQTTVSLNYIFFPY